MNKPKFSVRYTALMNRAAGVAKHEGGSLIERRHLLAALCAMSPKLLNRLLGCNQLFFVGELPFQDVSSLEPCKMAFSREAYRVLSIYGGVLGKVVEATDANLIDIHHVGAALLIDDSSDSPVHELLNANGLSVNNAKVIERVKRIGRKGAKKRREREIYRAVANIRMQMLDGIVGQEHAVSKVCDSLLGNWLLPQENRRPLTIMLCGDRGSGKSLFATKLTEAIVHNRDSVTVTFLSGGMFASENTSHDIPGYGPGWKAQSMGLVTGPVSKNPEEIIVMEDFDLLHPIARSHMLKVLTTARLMDEMLGREVDFSRAMIILICSAGCDTAKLGDTNMEKTRARIVEEIVSGMTESNRRDNVMALGEVATEVVMMKGLTADELRKVLVHTIDAEVLSIKNTISKKVVVDTNRLADVMLEGVCSLRPSGIAPMVKANVGDPIRKAIMESNGAKVKSVEVVIDSDSEVDVNTVAKNLAMRRRRLVTASASFEESRLVLRISSGDFVLLPAVCDGFIRIIPPKAGDSFDKLVGLEKPIAVLRHCIKYMHGETNINPGGGFLFVGGPGTGKSCLARSLAYEAGVPYALLNCAELTSPEAIINVFNKLRLYGKSGLVAIFDEIDGIGGDRDDNKSSAYIERLNLLLENIDGIANDPESRIVYVGLSNRMEAIDAALLRDGRFGRVINFRSLDVADRRKLLAMEISECGITPAPDEKILDLMAKTTNGMPGSMLKAIVHELAIMASESGPLTREMYAKARKIVMHGEGTTTVMLSDEELLSCAVHEAGHAVVCDAAGRDFNLASIIEDDPSRLGCVEPAEKTHCTSASILASIDIALAGLVGQEVMGLPPSGGESDLKMANQLAFDYIRNGFCREEWGLVYLEEPDEKMKALAGKILDERYCKVSKTLRDAKPILSRFAQKLAERRMLFHDDLRMIKKSLVKKGAEYGNEV